MEMSNEQTLAGLSQRSRMGCNLQKLAYLNTGGKMRKLREPWKNPGLQSFSIISESEETYNYSLRKQHVDSSADPRLYTDVPGKDH